MVDIPSPFSWGLVSRARLYILFSRSATASVILGCCYYIFLNSSCSTSLRSFSALIFCNSSSFCLLRSAFFLLSISLCYSYYCFHYSRSAALFALLSSSCLRCASSFSCFLRITSYYFLRVASSAYLRLSYYFFSSSARLLTASSRLASRRAIALFLST